MSTFDEESLEIFYSRLFPYDLMFEWLSYSHDRTDASDPNKDFFFKREFSFTKANDVYIRYLSFRDASEFKERVKRDQPHKIDIGAVYSFPAKDHTTVPQSKFRPMFRELVFDVDLTDYEEVQTKGPDGGSIWARGAWLYMAAAIKIVDATLREDFGFQHLLWVFSGRRGVHCWVCDEAALKLDDNERSAIVDYLTIITSAGKSNNGNAFGQSEHLDQRVKLTAPRHPSVRRAIEICKPLFKRACISEETGQGILANEERWNRVLEMLPNMNGIRETLGEEWKATASKSSSEKRWAQLEATVKATAKTSNFEGEQLLKALDAIILFHVYPRLDVNVSTHRNHLLKSPFVIHPKTGNVCVPILDIEKCDQFDPDNVPNLRTLVRELEKSSQTSLSPILEKFESTFLRPLQKSARAAERTRQEKLAAVTGSW